MTELTLTRVVLYKTGVGFFEKKGSVHLPEEKSVEIVFKNTTMNDLLKSFTIMRSKGDLIVTGVSYPGQDTNQDKMLEDSLIQLPEDATFQSLLSQLRGIRIEIEVASQSFEGEIVGTQVRSESVSDKSQGVIDEPYLIFKDPNEIIKTFRMKDISCLKIIDPNVNRDLQFFIDVIKSTKGDKTKNVTIYFDGTTDSEFILNALQEFPAWKCSYRLFILKNEDEGNTSDQDSPNPNDVNILLQGWAILDNILNEDWEKIHLTLVSGLPISFKYDSYSPQWISRPVVERAAKLEVSSPDKTYYSPPRGSPSEELASEQGVRTPRDVVSTIINNAESKGSGFEYVIPMPVNVKRNQSCLVPLLQHKSTAKIVSVYNETVDKTRPMLTLELKNETGSVLDTGPISVFNENIFEGEAVLPFMEKDEQQRIPYSVDQALEIHKEVKTQTQNYHEISIGTSIYKRQYIDKITCYTIKNISEFSKILILEHPKESDYKIYDPKTSDEESRNFDRFRIEIPATDKKEFTIKERRLLSDYSSLDGIPKTTLDEWLKSKLITKKVYQFLIHLIELVQQVQTNQQCINDLSTRKSRIATEQARMRKNMDVLGKSDPETKLNNRYLSKFNSGEAEIDEIDKQIADLQKMIADFNAEIDKIRRDGFK